MKNGALVIGAGSWGSAIASALIRSGCETSVLARKRKSVDALADGKCLQLPNCTSNFRINASRDPNLIKPARLIFVAVPVQKNSEVFDLISEKQRGSKAGVIILCAKGISTQRNGNAILLPDLLSEMLPNHPSAILSGPSFADEVFSGLQAALVVASDDPEITAEVQKTFEGSNLRVYRNNDPIGASIWDNLNPDVPRLLKHFEVYQKLLKTKKY